MPVLSYSSRIEFRVFYSRSVISLKSDDSSVSIGTLVMEVGIGTVRMKNCLNFFVFKLIDECSILRNFNNIYCKYLK